MGLKGLILGICLMFASVCFGQSQYRMDAIITGQNKDKLTFILHDNCDKKFELTQGRELFGSNNQLFFSNLEVWLENLIASGELDKCLQEK